MRFSVRDTIRNKITKEAGRIVRIVDPTLGKAYIVEVDCGSPWNITKEAFWRESDVKKIVVNHS
jgi:hypothetical protein